MIQVWASLPWAGPGAYYGEDAATLAPRLEALGVSGVIQGDHLFLPGPPASDPLAAMAADALTVLTTVAAHSGRLGVATLVANVSFQHPYLLLRRFASLARLLGGERVYAGLGAGWSQREYQAIGLAMPPHAERLDRLEESARLARTLFDAGYATLDGAYVRADDLPLAPASDVPPRLLIGGGSRRALELAARYADHVDLAPPHVAGANQFQKPLLATTDQIASSAAVARSGGRAPTTSVLMSAVVVCDDADADREEAALCERVGIAPRPLADCPYVLIGSPEALAARIRERVETIGLDWLVVPLTAVDALATDVLPLLRS